MRLAVPVSLVCVPPGREALLELPSRYRVDQHLRHPIVSRQDLRVGGEAVSGDEIADHFLGEIDVGRGNQAVWLEKGSDTSAPPWMASTASTDVCVPPVAFSVWTA
jgi:hypothetical protein